MSRRIFFIFFCLLLCTTARANGAQTPADDAQEELVLSLGGQAEATIGAGGLFSDGGRSAALLLHGGVGLTIDDAWTVFLTYDAKLHPWLDSRSIFSTVGPTVRYCFWRGAFVEIGGGVSWSYLEKGDYRQSKAGGGWLLRLGYVHFFHPNLGLIGQISVNQRWVGQLYTDLGLSLGPAVRF